MSETNMPAAEAINNDELELQSYELAFHILPTVAEGEVQGVFDALKNLIKKSGGELKEEEAPQRFDLAYDIEKHLEGKNRKFSSTYFGWVRFRIEASEINKLTEGIEGAKEILRYLLVKLTKVEDQSPFLFHESIASSKIQTIEEDISGEVEEGNMDEVAETPTEEVTEEVNTEDTVATSEETK